MNHFIHKLLFLCIIPCFGQQKTNQNALLHVITTVKGDLDNDGIDEKVIVYETNESNDSGTIRELQILKNHDKKWIVWQKSRKAVRESRAGGPKGEPFEGIHIKDNILHIHFFGGSNWKWAYTDSYKFINNEFKLIHYKYDFFHECDYWDSLDFNLSTGKAVAKSGYEKCEQQKHEKHTQETKILYKKGLHITLQNRNHIMWNKNSFKK